MTDNNVTDPNPIMDLSFLNAAQGMSSQEQVAKAEGALALPTRVDLPRHLYIPQGAESIDLRTVYNVPSPTIDFKILEFIAPQGAVTRFINYAIFNDGDAEINYNFKPFVNGNRVLRYHGHPLADGSYKLALGLAPDLSQNSLVGCQLTLNPGDVLQWLITNASGVDTAMGVRMVGYFDTQSIRVTPKFG
jgi:hypothetical protein